MRNPASSSPSSATCSAAAASTAEGSAKSTPCCSKVGLKRGPWTPEEDELLANYINKDGEGRWRTLPKRAGLLRCGKSCRLRWMNYLRPSVKRGHIAPDEEDLILRLHRLLGNRWSLIAGRIPGRTDNEIKNYWNTHLSKKLISQGIDPRTHKPLTDVQQISNSSNKQKEVYLSTSKPLPNPNANSEEANSGVLVGVGDNGEAVEDSNLNFHNKANTTNPEFCSDPTRNSSNHHHNVNANELMLPFNSNLMNADNHHPHHLNFNGESPGSFDDQDDDPNYCSDDVFSSFLNSLINEDMFAAQTHPQLPRYDALLGSTQPNPAPSGWEAIPPGFHLNISPDNQPQ